MICEENLKSLIDWKVLFGNSYEFLIPVIKVPTVVAVEALAMEVVVEVGMVNREDRGQTLL